MNDSLSIVMVKKNRSIETFLLFPVIIKDAAIALKGSLKMSFSIVYK